MESYENFEEKVKKISNIQQAAAVLGWDQEVMMPEEGIKPRSQQKSALTSVTHGLMTDKKLGELIEQLEDEDLSEEQRANIREVKREKKKAVKVPEDLLKKISETESEAVDAWKKSREQDDFQKFAPHLEKMVELKREYAGHIDPDEEPYKVLFKDFEPFIRFETMEEILQTLKDRLTEITEKIKESDSSLEKGAFKGQFSEEKQKKLNRELVEALNFDFSRGRLDVSTHPFTSGNRYDTRITTRYNEQDLSKSILPTVHETGHGLYNQGLPEESFGVPAGSSRDLSVHESQSRLWENHVARSKPFMKFLLPKLREKFPEQFEEVTADECYESVNQVYEDNPIRVEADELTYHLHIVVRFELGKELVNGDIAVEELPEKWNDKMEQYLGFRPENDAEGCLQDIHWGWGNFGYFPTYTVGSVLAAQIFEAASQDIDSLDQKIEEGEFDPLLEWLRENIHSKGKVLKTEDLIKEATGRKPTPEPFISYIEEKYSDLYSL